jgi:hypothetical protein
VFLTVALSVLSTVMSGVLTVARWAVGEVLTHALFAALLLVAATAAVWRFPDSAYYLALIGLPLSAGLVLWFGLGGPARLSQTTFALKAGCFPAGLSPAVAPGWYVEPNDGPDSVAYQSGPADDPDAVVLGPETTA